MLKQIITQEDQIVTPAQLNWLDLENLARLELTSEDEAYPIESALTLNIGKGWRAAESGKQIIRIVFHEPQKLTRIQLTFREEVRARTQEFQLRWLAAGDLSYREIVRQQYNFSPPETKEEQEDYWVDLDEVTGLELHITPDINQPDAFASLAQIRLC
jgi:hypothetical protein